MYGFKVVYQIASTSRAAALLRCDQQQKYVSRMQS